MWFKNYKLVKDSFSNVEKLKDIIGKTIFFSRWGLLPVYFSLIMLLFIFGIRFIAITSSLIIQSIHLDTKHLIIQSLELIDMVMVVSLISMVLFSGYEIFVNRMQMNEHIDRLEGLTGVTTSILKLRIALTIVTISSIELLKTFIDINDLSPHLIKRQIILHLTLLASVFIIALVDKLTARKPQ